MTIAIVGGGLAGATCAAELRARGYQGRIVVYGAEQHLPYERPPLSKSVLLGQASPDSATVHDAEWYDDHDVELQLGTRVRAIHPTEHTLHTDRGETGFHRLVLATGATPRRFAHADSSGKPVHYLRTISDSMRLQAALAGSPRVAVVGGGWIGLEVASAARQFECPVTVYEMASLPLLAVLGPEVARTFADLHRSHGVRLNLGTPVNAADLGSSDIVVVGIGAVPETSLAETAGLEVHNGVLVDQFLRTSHPDVFAVGDIANHDHPVLGRRIRVEHWDTAVEQAKVAAHNALGDAEPYARQPYFFTDQYDLGMEYFGSVGPDGYDNVVVTGDTAGAFQAHWIRNGVVIAAMHANDWDAADQVRESVGRPLAAPTRP